MNQKIKNTIVESSSGRITPVNTFGWDTAYVASFPIINSAILKDKSYPSSFEHTDSAGVHIKGKWKSWQLSIGGAGQNLQMNCVVENGEITALSQSGDLKDASIFIQIRLSILPTTDKINDPTSKPGTGKAKKLVMNPNAQGNDPAVSVLASSSYPHLSSEILKDLVGTIFSEYFNANTDAFTHTFAIMNLNEEADKDGFQWLKPSAYQYAVASPESATMENSAFGLISMVDENKIDPHQQQAVDSRALTDLPTGANSSFVISQHNVAKHMLMRGAISTIQGSKKSDFTLSSDGLSITNVNKLTWGHFKTKHGVISPTLAPGNFLIRCEGNFVYLEIDNAEHSPSKGITVHMNLTQKFSFKTIQRKDGKYVFIPEEDPFGKPDFHSNVSLSDGLEITQLITEIVIAVVGVLVVGSGIGAALAEGAEVAVNAGEDAANIAIDAEMAEAAAAENPEEVAAAEDAGADDADQGAEDPDNPAQVQNGGILTSAKFRLANGLIGAMAGVVLGGIGVARYIVEKDYDSVPEFDHFAANCLGASKWPLMDDYDLVSASFRDSLVIATKLKQKK